MSLFWATFLSAIFLLATGVSLLIPGTKVRALLKSFPRSRRAAYVTIGLGGAWVLYHITNLGEADFGNYKHLIFIAFAALALLSLKYVPDFLAVRGMVIIFLLVANVLLSAAFLEEPAARLFLVTPLYVGIFLSLYLAVAPYRLRDFFNWQLATPARQRLAGSLLTGYGVVLLLVAFTY